MKRSFRLKDINSGELYTIENSSLLIGRSPQCDIFIDSTLLSRHHASVVLLDDDSAVINDLDSTNGTFVNSMRINRSHRLEHNDVITIGDAKFIIIDLSLNESDDSSEESFASPSEFVGQDSTSNRTMVQSPIFKSLGLDPSTFNFAKPTEDDSLGGVVEQPYNSANYDHQRIPAVFVVKSGRKKGSVIRLVLPIMAEKEWAVGRSQLCDVVLEDPTVSSNHAIIRCDGERWEIEDCQSTNGIKLNGQKVASTAFEHDDVISIGSIKLLFQVNAHK